MTRRDFRIAPSTVAVTILGLVVAFFLLRGYVNSSDVDPQSIHGTISIATDSGLCVSSLESGSVRAGSTISAIDDSGQPITSTRLAQSKRDDDGCVLSFALSDVPVGPDVKLAYGTIVQTVPLEEAQWGVALTADGA